MALRMYRILVPAMETDSTSTGITIWAATSAAPPAVPRVVMPPDGSMPRFTVNRYTNSRDRKNPGMLLPKKEAVTTA